MIRYFKIGIYTLLFCLLAAGRLIAQDPQYFIYIQHEKQQPFYVKYKGKILSSSDRGYIILAELPAGSLPIAIGFPKSDAPEQQFKIKVGKNDQGFLLKRTDEKTYALYNLQTFAVTMAGSEGEENGRMQSLEQTAATPTEAAPQTDSAPQTAPETAAADLAPAPPAADTNGQAMMAALKKDLDSAMAGKADVSTTTAAAPAPKPVKKNSKFAETLDKVVDDDRPDDISLEEPKAPAPAPAAGAAAPVAIDVSAVTLTPGESRRNRRKRNKDREPLTEEEQSLAQQVLAEERKNEPQDSTLTEAQAPKETPIAPPADQPVTDPAQTPAVAADATAPAVLPATEASEEKKPKRSKKKKDTDPQFIEFMDDSTQQRVTEPATEATTPAPAVENPDMVAVTDTTTKESKREKRKKRKLLDSVEITENPNNIVKDSVDYDSPRRKEKTEAEAGQLKMINSDCEKQLDDEGFRKLLRRFVAAKDDEGMIAAFRRYTRGYCLETAQVRRLAQLMNTDEYRYQLLDLAYSRVYDSEKYASLSDLLVDGYYQGRFKAMLHK
jgi:hypothetical protein